MNELQGTPIAKDILQLFAVKQDTEAELSITELEAMARSAASAIEAAKGKVRAREEQTAEYRRLGRALNDEISAQSAELIRFRAACIQERFDNFDCVDVTGLSQQLRARSDAHRLNVDAYTWLVEEKLQDCAESTLVAIWQKCRLETAQANIAAVLSEARTNLALGAAFQEEGTLAVVGGRSSAMHAYADEMLRQEEAAKANVEQFRIRRSKLDAQRGLTGGAITSLQAKHAI